MGLHGISDDVLVLFQDASRAIDEKAADLASFHRGDGTQGGVFVHRFIDLAFFDESGGVDDDVILIVFLKGCVYRVPGGSGDVAHDDAVFA